MTLLVVLPVVLSAGAPLPPADAARGAQLWESRCTGCHALDRNQVGPRHRGVYGRRAGSLPDFDYSPALKASGIVWREATLNAWLTSPETLVPGQKMGFSVALPQDRADIIAYLKSLSGPKPK